MLQVSQAERRALEVFTRAQLERLQLEKLNRLLAQVLPHNRFYAEKLASLNLPLQTVGDLKKLPYTFKQELSLDLPNYEFAANLTWPVEHYVRYHRTSGTRGRPMVVLDTAADWQWWMEIWQFVLDAAEIGPEDRVLMAFSFGPFVGFWSAFDAVIARGSLAVPGGGMNTLQRLELMRSCRATVVFCTPSYALHMAEVGAQHQIDVASLEVRRIVVAGEPGGSVPHTKRRIEELWNARVVDHGGASEVGPWGYADASGMGLHVIESEFIAEFLSVETGSDAHDGELAELVLTSLGRFGSPVIRYRTGDLVRPRWTTEPNAEGHLNRFVRLEGGILGRADDMMIVRGVNIFPSSIEQILRGFPEVIEYRLTARRHGAMDELSIDVEDRLAEPVRIANELQVRLGLKVEVRCVPPGSLPRFEGKGKRFVDER
jgi:phenylacetate-CoA ligase